jgi:hypothetical protein
LEPADPIELSCLIIESGLDNFASASFGGVGQPPGQALLSANVLRPAGTVRTLSCDACEQPHSVELEYRADHGRFGWMCPHAGFVTTPDADIATVAFDADALARELARAIGSVAGGQRWKVRALDRTSWVLGLFQIRTRWAPIALVGGWPIDRAEILSALLKLPAQDEGLILSTNPAASPTTVAGRFAVLPLWAAITCSAEGKFSTHKDVLDAALLNAALARGPRLGGRPSLGLEKVARVVDALKRRIDELPERGAPSLVQREWPAVYPDEKVPPLTTLRRYVRKLAERGSL